MIALFFLAGFVQAAEPVFNFAYQNPHGGPVYVQAGATAGESLKSSCEEGAGRCDCELQYKAGRKRAGARFSPSGAYFVCEAEGGQPASRARIVRKGAPLSPWLDVLNYVGIRQVLGNELDYSRVRSIYQYRCSRTFLQKQGTSEFSFDCSSQPQVCGSPGSKPGDFCLLKTDSFHYLYADNYSTNFSQKGADLFYGPSGQICGLVIPQYECAGVPGLPQREFALYGQPIGIWNLPVVLDESPEAAAVPQGYAQRAGPGGECPPWLEMRSQARASLSLPPGQISSNFPDVFTSLRAVKAGSTPFDLAVTRISGGDCSGASCSRPNLVDGYVAVAPFVEDAETRFCAIPAELTFD